MSESEIDVDEFVRTILSILPEMDMRGMFQRKSMVKALKCIKQQQDEIDKHRWIPVEERLPKKTEDDLRPQVLVFDGESVTGALWRHYKCGWDFETDRGKPTHWKPIILPEQ